MIANRIITVRVKKAAFLPTGQSSSHVICSCFTVDSSGMVEITGLRVPERMRLPGTECLPGGCRSDMPGTRAMRHFF